MVLTPPQGELQTVSYAGIREKALVSGCRDQGEGLGQRVQGSGRRPWSAGAEIKEKTRNQLKTQQIA